MKPLPGPVVEALAGAAYVIWQAERRSVGEPESALARTLLRVTEGSASLEAFQNAVAAARATSQAVGLARFCKGLGRGLDASARLTIFSCAAASARVAGILSPWARRGLEAIAEELMLNPADAKGVLEGRVLASPIGMLRPVTTVRDDGAYISAMLRAAGWQDVTPLAGVRLSYLSAAKNWLVVEHHPDESSVHLYVVSQNSPEAQGLLLAAVFGPDGRALEPFLTALATVQDILEASSFGPGLRTLAHACPALYVLEDGNWAPAVDGSLEGRGA